MKRHITTLALVAAVTLGITASPASAQDRPAERRGPGDSEQRIERRLNYLDEQLNLTDSQEQQIQGVLEEHAREMQEHFATRQDETQQDQEAQWEYRRAQAEELDRAIAAALTPEQQEKYAALKAERPNRRERSNRDRGRMMREGDRAERMAQRMERFAKELDLTGEQREQIEQLFKEQHETARSWMESNPNATREERHAYMAERMKEGTASLESVLTEEQQEKLRALREEMEQKMEERREKWGERRSQRGKGDAQQRGR